MNPGDCLLYSKYNFFCSVGGRSHLDFTLQSRALLKEKFSIVVAYRAVPFNITFIKTKFCILESYVIQSANHL